MLTFLFRKKKKNKEEEEQKTKRRRFLENYAVNLPGNVHTWDRGVGGCGPTLASTLLNANLIFVNLPAGFHKSKPPSLAAARLWTLQKEANDEGGIEREGVVVTPGWAGRLENIRSTSSFLKIDSSQCRFDPPWDMEPLRAQVFLTLFSFLFFFFLAASKWNIVATLLLLQNVD